MITPERVGAVLNLIAVIWPRMSGKLSFQLFCTPRKGRSYTSKEERFLASSHMERLPVQDFEIQCYHWKGDRPCVLLAHGWDSNAARWRALITALRNNGFEVAALDAPALGKSGSKRTNGVLYAEAIQVAARRYSPRYIVGHSFGGMATAYFCSNTDEVPIQKLFLLGTPSRLSTVVKEFYRILGLSRRAQRAMSRHFEQSFDLKVDQFSVEQFIAKVQVPGYVIHDRGDIVVPLKEAEAIHRNWPDSELWITENFGHSLQSKSVYNFILKQLMD